MAGNLLRSRIAVTACLAVLTATEPVGAEPWVPVDDAEVLERLPSPPAGERGAVRALRDRHQQAPDDLATAVELAGRYLAAARADGDPRSVGWAEAALRPWWSDPQPPTAVLVLRATIHQHRHRFEDALADLGLAAARNPRQPQVWLTRAAILRVQGRFNESADACRALFGLVPPLVALTCSADAAAGEDRARLAYQRLAEANAAATDVDARQKLWTLTVLAELAERLGDPAAADAHYRAAGALGLRNGALAAAHADFLLDRGRADEVLALLAGAPGSDALLLRRAIAATGAGAADAAEPAERLRARFASARARADQPHLREEARFALAIDRDPGRALDLALENWRQQREPADARLILESARAAGAVERATPVLDWLDETGFYDVRLRALVERLRDPAA